MCAVEAESLLVWVWDAERRFFPPLLLLLFIRAEPELCCVHVRRAVGAAGSLCLSICAGAMPRMAG